MSTLPVVSLLVFNAFLLLIVTFTLDDKSRSRDVIFLSLLFFCSGMPPLVYQIVWQRVLFAMYGVNAQSVSVVVTAFMLGLGIGSLVGGRLSQRFPKHGILIFGLAELGVALFGLFSLRIFHQIASQTSGASLPSVIIFSLLLLLIPTALMGATLPLLVEHLVTETRGVGKSVSTLYFVNTFGSAVACYFCAVFLLRNLGQSGSVTIAACVNAAIGAIAYVYARGSRRKHGEESVPANQSTNAPTVVTVPVAMVIAGGSGFVALGFEIAWFRVFSLASSDRAPAFALLLSTYLAGIAAGSYISEKLVENRGASSAVKLLGISLLLAGTISSYLPPLVATLAAHKISFLMSAPAFFLTAALIGSVLPVLCLLAVKADQKAGQGVSLVYVSNILGSAIGSLGIGFVLMQYFRLVEVSLGLATVGVLLGSAVLLLIRPERARPPIWAWTLIATALVAIPISSTLYFRLFERLVFGDRPEAHTSFAHVVENRNGVIGVTNDAAVFGGGVYDGYFNVDPTNDLNLVARIYALSAFSLSPKRVLVIGLASGSWGQILAHHPQVELLDAVEINPGYLELIRKYPVVSSFLQNPKVNIYVDDGRRWLLAHPDARYDVIVANTTFNWRDHSTGLLSVEFFQMVRKHLNPGGVYFFNTTEENETIATALSVFPYGLRVINFVVVSDSPIAVDKERWLSVLRQYKIDGRIVFDLSNPTAKSVLTAYMALADTVSQPPRFFGFESSDSMRQRLGRLRKITDDNMGLEWEKSVKIPWH
jgi:predicted membrane-bound spermidine synthase